MFVRDGDNLRHRVTLTADQAQKGYRLNIQTLDGRTIEWVFLECCSEHVIEGEGMPRKQGGNGNMVVEFIVM